MNDRKLSILYILVGVLLIGSAFTMTKTLEAFIVFVPGIGISALGILTLKYTPAHDKN